MKNVRRSRSSGAKKAFSLSLSFFLSFIPSLTNMFQWALCVCYRYSTLKNYPQICNFTLVSHSFTTDTYHGSRLPLISEHPSVFDEWFRSCAVTVFWFRTWTGAPPILWLHSSVRLHRQRHCAVLYIYQHKMFSEKFFSREAAGGGSWLLIKQYLSNESSRWRDDLEEANTYYPDIRVTSCGVIKKITVPGAITWSKMIRR